jgi:hypothetical protein
MVPYWEAGAAYLPYGKSYFTTAALTLLGPQSQVGGGGLSSLGGGMGS